MPRDLGSRTITAAVTVAIILFLTGCSLHHAAPLPAAVVPLRSNVPSARRLSTDLEAIANPLVIPRSVELTDGLDPDEAAVLALVLNPDLIAACDAHGETSAQLLQAGLATGTTVTIDFDASI